MAAVNLFFLDEGLAGRLQASVVNVGTGTPRSFTDMGRIVSAVSGSPAPVTIPFPDDLRGQYQAYTCADTTRLRGAGWTKPMMTLEEGIAAYWKALSSP